MPRITTAVLDAFRRIYRTPGGVPASPLDLETTTPLQIVHDVSRLAELGTGLGPEDGFAQYRLTNALPAGGGATVTVDPYDLVETLGGNRRDHRVWLLGCMGFTNGLDVTTFATLFQTIPTVVNIFPTPLAQTMSQWIGGGAAESSGGQLHGITDGESLGFMWPVLALPGGLLSFFVDPVTGLTGTWDAVVFAWLGAKGVQPPTFTMAR